MWDRQSVLPDNNLDPAKESNMDRGSAERTGISMSARSLSVTIPTESPRSTMRAVAPAWVIRRAASRIG